MTVFENIKTNNWPAASNEHEDFLVLQMPLNDKASLTESMPVVVGGHVISPKRTLELKGGGRVASLEAGLYSGNSAGGAFYSTYTWADAFDGALNTGPFVYSTTTNTLTLPPGVTWSESIRVHALRYSGEFEINGTDILAYHTISSTAAWYDLTSTLGSSGTLSTITIGGVNTNYMKLMAVELDHEILMDPAGGPKKHYDSNAYFDGSSTIELNNSGIILDGDYCVEGYFKTVGNVGEHTRIVELKPANLAFYIYGSNKGTYVQLGNGSSINGGSNTWSEDTWHHFAVTRQDSVNRLFIDGIQKGSSVTESARFDLSTSMNFNGSNGGSYRFTGAMQDLRIYNGTAKYTANFTPPSAILG